MDQHQSKSRSDSARDNGSRSPNVIRGRFPRDPKSAARLRRNLQTCEIGQRFIESLPYNPLNKAAFLNYMEGAYEKNRQLFYEELTRAGQSVSRSERPVKDRHRAHYIGAIVLKAIEHNRELWLWVRHVISFNGLADMFNDIQLLRVRS